LKFQPKEKPFTKVFRNSTEGYALDWNPKVAGNLISGSCNGEIYSYQFMNQSEWVKDAQPIKYHLGSVEDLQWSPFDESVFISCNFLFANHRLD
jgi:ribosome assembly protein RRB1